MTKYLNVFSGTSLRKQEFRIGTPEAEEIINQAAIYTSWTGTPHMASKTPDGSEYALYFNGDPQCPDIPEFTGQYAVDPILNSLTSIKVDTVNNTIKGKVYKSGDTENTGDLEVVATSYYTDGSGYTTYTFPNSEGRYHMAVMRGIQEHGITKSKTTLTDGTVIESTYVLS